MFLVPHTIYEFWVVATRPVEVNGLGMNAEQVGELLAAIRAAEEKLASLQAEAVEHARKVAEQERELAGLKKELPGSLPQMMPKRSRIRTGKARLKKKATGSRRKSLN